MGTVTSSTVLLPDGSIEQVAGSEFPAGGVDRTVLLQYDYRPDLVPPRAAPNTGMWRYRDLLPLGDGPIRYPLQIGGTPLVTPPRLREHLGLPGLYLKDETRSPTGSNKDRATALVLEHALRAGATMVSCASTGNVAVSLAVGAAAARLRAVIFVPASVGETKLTVMLLAGATVLKVAEGYDAAFKLSEQAAATFGWYDRNTGVNPATIEAKKTVAFEIWEQLDRTVPDVVVAPVGDGPTLAALAKGFRELRLCGASNRMPRIVGVQAEGAQPVKRAWEGNVAIRPEEPNTCADGIAVGNPVTGRLVLQDVAETGGGFVASSDDTILEAIRTLASYAGIVAEPAGAAAFSGLAQAVEQGLIRPDERVVVLVTGTGFKAPQFLHPIGNAATIHADLSEVERALQAT